MPSVNTCVNQSITKTGSEEINVIIKVVSIFIYLKINFKIYFSEELCIFL